MQVVDAKTIIEKFDSESKSFYIKFTKNFYPIKGIENFYIINKKIMQIFDNEICCFLNHISEYISNRLLVVVHIIIQDKFLSKYQYETEDEFNEFVRNVVYSLYFLVLKVIFLNYFDSKILNFMFFFIIEY